MACEPVKGSFIVTDYRITYIILWQFFSVFGQGYMIQYILIEYK